MRKYIPKFTEGGTTDPLSSDPNGTQRKPLGTFKQEKAWQQKNAGNDSYTRKEYRTDLKAAGQPVGIASNTGQKITGGITKGLSMTTDIAKNFIPVDQDSNFSGQQAVGDALMSSGNPYAMIAGAAFKTLSVIDQATGMGINTIDKNQAADAGVSKGERILNNVLGFFPGNPIAAISSTKTSKADQMTSETSSLSSAFGGSVNDVVTAGGMGDNRYLFGGSKINSFIDKANRDNRLLTEMSMTNTQRKQSNYGSDLAQQNINRYAGNNYNSNRIGKNGFKLMTVSEIREILEQRKEPVIKSFQNGGVVGVDTNIIAEGKYHAHLNHLGDVSEDLSDLTKKGIPVVTHNEGGEIEQIAEIEKKEIIFRLEVTEKLEKLFKDGSEEAMIEAGKLVTKEIIENTQDNSGEVLRNE